MNKYSKIANMLDNIPVNKTVVEVTSLIGEASMALEEADKLIADQEDYIVKAARIITAMKEQNEALERDNEDLDAECATLTVELKDAKKAKDLEKVLDNTSAMLQTAISNEKYLSEENRKLRKYINYCGALCVQQGTTKEMIGARLAEALEKRG